MLILNSLENIVVKKNTIRKSDKSKVEISFDDTKIKIYSILRMYAYGVTIQAHFYTISFDDTISIIVII